MIETPDIDSSPVTLAGQEHRLVYDFEAALALERELQIDVLNEGISESILSSLGTFTTVLHGGLRRLHPEISREQLVRMVRPREYGRLRDEVLAALRADLEDRKGDGAEGPPVAQDSPGESSGPSADSTSA